MLCLKFLVRPLADDSGEILNIKEKITTYAICCSCDWPFNPLHAGYFSPLLSFAQKEKKSQKMLSAAVVIGPFKVLIPKSNSHDKLKSNMYISCYHSGFYFQHP